MIQALLILTRTVGTVLSGIGLGEIIDHFFPEKQSNSNVTVSDLKDTFLITVTLVIVSLIMFWWMFIRNKRR